MSDYVTISLPDKEEFPTGSRRNSRENKGRYDLIPVEPLMRLAQLYERGANVYGARNWEKGQPVSRFYDSAIRHLLQWASGQEDEDHLAAVLFNVMGIMFTEKQFGETNLVDIGPHTIDL